MCSEHAEGQPTRYEPDAMSVRSQDCTRYVLVGRCLNAERYLLEMGAESEASLTLRGGVPVQYDFVGYTEAPHRRLLFRMRLSLRPVLRTSEIDRRLHIERE